MNDELVAVTDKVDNAGVVTYWQLSGETDLTELAQTWEDAGLDPRVLPNPPTAKHTLRRTVGSISGRRLLCRPAHKAWAIVEEHVHGEDVSYTVLMRAKINGERELVLETVERDDPDLQVRLRDTFERLQNTLSPSDLGYWLIRRAEAMHAVGLRDRGGIYFIPHTATDEWQDLVRVVQAVGDHNVYSIPAMQSQEAVRAILDAVSKEAQDDVAQLENELTDNNITPRKLKGRARKAEEILQKVQAYEQLLNVSMGKLTENVENLQANISAALLQHAADDDDGKGANAA